MIQTTITKTGSPGITIKELREFCDAVLDTGSGEHAPVKVTVDAEVPTLTVVTSSGK